jgi:hypothetical protein
VPPVTEATRPLPRFSDELLPDVLASASSFAAVSVPPLTVTTVGLLDATVVSVASVAFRTAPVSVAFAAIVSSGPPN